MVSLFYIADCGAVAGLVLAADLKRAPWRAFGHGVAQWARTGDRPFFLMVAGAAIAVAATKIMGIC